MKTIYLDMDGVVADWDRRVAEIIGHRLPSHSQWPDTDWRRMVQFQRFYWDLPLMADARYLVKRVEEIAQQHGYAVKFLTAVPGNNDFPHAFEDKIHWAAQYWPHIPVWFGPYSQDKQMRSRPGDILIDDRPSNIEQWQARGGWGILYHGQAVPALEELMSLL